MALIALEEAAKLGLLPREFMDFFPAVGRSQLFGSPLAIRFGRQSRAGAGPLERAVGGYGFQHAAPGITPLRFGLGPLMAGLGLSPSPSAISAPGMVPAGRAAKARGGPVSVETLLGRQEPQDIALLIRLVQAGLLSPSVLEALARPAGAARTATPLPAGAAPPPRPAAGPSGIAEALAQTRRALTTASAAEQLVRAIQGAPARDTAGGGAIPADVAAGLDIAYGGLGGLSMEATRTLEGVLGPLSPEEAAKLTPEDIVQLEALARDVRLGGGFDASGLAGQQIPTGLVGIPEGATFTGRTLPPLVSGPPIPVDVGEAGEVGVPLAGPGAGGPPTQGGGLALPSAGQTLGGLLTALQLAQAGQQLAEGRTGPGALQAAQGALQAAKQLNLLPAAAVGALPVANIALGGLALGLQGSGEPKHSFQIREAQERQGVLGGALAGLGSKEAQMASMVVPGAGFVLGPIVGALRNLGVFGQHRTLAQKLRAEQLEAGRIGDTLRGPIAGLAGAGDFEAFFNAGGAVGYMSQPAEFVRRALSDPNSIMAASAPGGRWDEPSAMGVRTSLLVPSVQATVTSAIQNARRLAEQPGALDSLARAEYQAQRRVLENRVTDPNYLDPDTAVLAGGADRPGAAELRAAGIADLRMRMNELDRQFQADPYSVLPPNFQALLPPSPPDTGPPPSAATPPPPAAGEEEAPLTPTEPLASLRAGGPVTRTGLYQLHAGETVVPADQRGEDPNAPRGSHWYLPLRPGEPIQAKKNPDPAAYWRLATTSEEATAAIRSGDPAETPILAPQMILTLPPRKRAAAAEFLRRRQYEDPGGTLMDVVQAQTPRTTLAPPTTGRGLAMVAA